MVFLEFRLTNFALDKPDKVNTKSNYYEKIYPSRPDGRMYTFLCRIMQQVR